MNAGLSEGELAQVNRALFELGNEYAGTTQEFVDTYEVWQTAIAEYRRVKANALLRAPINDPKDTTGKRKYTKEDRDAWVDVQPDVQEAYDARQVAEIAHKYHAEDIWSRKSRLEAYKELSNNLRAEMKL